MKVFKFGGASLKDAKAIQHVATIIESAQDNLIVIVSALGKTTDTLEKIFYQSYSNKDFTAELQSLKGYHNTILKNLFPDNFLYDHAECLRKI